MLKETQGFVENLKKEGIVTWFDIGLFLDRLKEEKKIKRLNSMTFGQFKKKFCKNIAFINYDFGIDGVTVESIKYAKAIKKRKLFPTDDSAKKVMYLAIQAASKKWTMPIRNWKMALNRFMIEFEDRLAEYI